MYVRSGELDKSISVYREAIRMQEKALGRSHPNTLVIAANLGVVYKDAGRFAEAIPLLEEVYEASKREPSIAWIGGQLLEGYTMQADPAKPESIAKVVTLVRELLAQERAELPEASPVLAGQLIGYSQSLLRVKAWDAAETPIREALSIREKTQPDAWSTFNTRSMLGGVLLGQEKIDEAEPLLLGGYQGLKDREATIPPQAKVRVQEALERLVKLYEAKGDEAKAAAWRARLDAAKAEQTKSEVEGDGR